MVYPAATISLTGRRTSSSVPVDRVPLAERVESRRVHLCIHIRPLGALGTLAAHLRVRAAMPSRRAVTCGAARYIAREERELEYHARRARTRSCMRPSAVARQSVLQTHRSNMPCLHDGLVRGGLRERAALASRLVRPPPADQESRLP